MDRAGCVHWVVKMGGRKHNGRHGALPRRLNVGLVPNNRWQVKGRRRWGRREGISLGPASMAPSLASRSLPDIVVVLMIRSSVQISRGCEGGGQLRG